MNISPIKHLYETAFPPDERRDFDELQKLFAEENDMHIQIEQLNGELLGFIIYWTLEQFIYIEHFAVAEPFRGCRRGTQLFGDFLKNAGFTVVLEVEPPENAVAEKRIRFYERLGMMLCRFPYTQPPYNANKNAVDMRIMSNRNLDNEVEFEKMKKVIFERVYKQKNEDFEMNNSIIDEIENIFLLDEDIDFCCKLLLKLTFNVEDGNLMQEICLKIILSDRDEDLCGLAITCLGHLARIHRTMNKKKVISILDFLKNKNKYLNRIDDAIDDINDFAK